MNKNIEIISLIYKSTQYLKFVADQFKSGICNVDGWDVHYRILANDATKTVIDYLPSVGIPYTIYNSSNPNEYYINRVYKAYNECIRTSMYDNVCLVNSDDVFCKDWLTNLLKHHDGINIPTSRLIESGKKDGNGGNGINLKNFNFGRHPNNFRMNEWLEFSEKIKQNRILEKGLYMPCVFETNRVKISGYYPNGNIYANGIGVNDSNCLFSGDDYYFHEILEKKYGMKHITVMDSPVYHIVEGEKDEEN